MALNERKQVVKKNDINWYSYIRKNIEKDIAIILWTHIYEVDVFEIKHIYND